MDVDVLANIPGSTQGSLTISPGLKEMQEVMTVDQLVDQLVDHTEDQLVDHHVPTLIGIRTATSTRICANIIPV